MNTSFRRVTNTARAITDTARAITNTVRATTTDVDTFISAVKNKELPDKVFFTAYSTHLKETVLQLNNDEFDTFIDILRLCNVYIVGHSFLYYKLNLMEYNDKLDLFIDIKKLQKFLDNISMEFIPINLKFTSKYSTLAENIIEVEFDFHNTNKLIKIFLHIYDNLNIDEFIKRNLSIFGIWYNPNTNIYINDITENFFAKKQPSNGIISYIIPSYINLNVREEVEKVEQLVEKPIKLFTQYTQYIEAKIPIENYETIIIKLLISNLSKYLFIPTNESQDRRHYKDESLLSSFIKKSDNHKETYIEKFNTDENATNKYKILTSLDIILHMYNNKKYMNFYTYDLFHTAFIEFSTIYNISMQMNAYIDKVIREEILKNFNIKIIISNDGNIEFKITDIISDKKLDENDEIYIKQVLLFYYKNKIYKIKSNYKFVDIITNNHKLVEQFFNINTDTSKEKIAEYHKLLLNNTGVTYNDLILSSEIENVEDYINENDDNILLVEPGISTITCISKSDLDDMISNFKDNFFYDCKLLESDYLSNVYIKLSTSSNSHYIHYKYILSLFKSPNKLFYIHRTDITIQKTVTYKNTPKGRSKQIDDSVSANHCQSGSDIKISTISTISNANNTVHKTRYNNKINKISFNKQYPISLIT